MKRWRNLKANDAKHSCLGFDGTRIGEAHRLMSRANTVTNDSFDINNQPMLHPSEVGPLLIIKDIEALLELEKDECGRHDDAESKRMPARKTASVGSIDSVPELVGLPAPPRGPRKGQIRVISGMETDGSSSLIPETGAIKSENQATHLRGSSSSDVPIPSSTLNSTSARAGPSSRQDDTCTGLNGCPRQRLLTYETGVSSLGMERTQSDKKSLPWHSGVNVTPIFQLPRQPVQRLQPNDTRTLLSNQSSGSYDSGPSYTCPSTHDSLSTVHEPRISVSGTTRPPSDYDALPSPVPLRQMYCGEPKQHFTNESYAVSDQQYIRGSTDPASASPSAAMSLPGNILDPESRIREPTLGSNSIVDKGERSPVLMSSEMVSGPYVGPIPALPVPPKPGFQDLQFPQPPSRLQMNKEQPLTDFAAKRNSLIPYRLLTSFSHSVQYHVDSLPPTINNLNPHERAGLVRKSRKLTQVLGETPSATNLGANLDPSAFNNCFFPISATSKDYASLSPSEDGVSNCGHQSLFENTVDRSESLSPIVFNSFIDDSDESISPSNRCSTKTSRFLNRIAGDSTRNSLFVNAADSFMELTDSDKNEATCSVSDQSISSANDELQRMEDQRRRKRERLAKLHRFLGSRIPAEIVLSPSEMGLPLPPADPNLPYPSEEPSRLQIGRRRRRSLSLTGTPRKLPEMERVREVLRGKGKALAVKRALKMEKVFGEQPPQKLFHTSGIRTVDPMIRDFVNHDVPITKSAPSSPTDFFVDKLIMWPGKGRNNNRPESADSSRSLLGSFKAESFERSRATQQPSKMYVSYRSSLISLANMMENDDKASLVELHEYINEDSSTRFAAGSHHCNTDNDSIRRRSLPFQASQLSLSSQLTTNDREIEVSPFELRRRRAAKLSSFFGVSYRGLFGEVLESIEMGVREDEGKGKLNADEAKDLLAQLTKLKKRRDELP